MKILFPYLARWHSANRSRYHQLLTHLCQRGHQVILLTAPPMALGDISQDLPDKDLPDKNLGVPCPPPVRPLPKGMELHELLASPPYDHFWQWGGGRTKLLKKGLLALASIPQIRRTLREERIDLLFLYNLPQVPLLNLVDCPVHFDLADDLVAMMEGEGRSLFRWGGGQAAAVVQKRMLTKATTVTVASSVLAEQISRPALLLPNGADLVELDQLDGLPLDGEGHPWGLTPLPGAVIGFVGAFEYWVDLELLVEVASRLPGMTFLFVGGGRRFAELQRRIEERHLRNVRLTGPLPYAQAMRAVRRMDICLLPFTHSAVSDGSCPLKLFEYAALRRPIISTSTVEVGRLGEGWVFFADRPDEVATTIERLLTDQPGTRAAVEAGRALVESTYRWPLLAERFESYLLEQGLHP
jgi:glycosyltransferase involved in cell wall biosynthesis